jgi:hypothetical protein
MIRLSPTTRLPLQQLLSPSLSVPMCCSPHTHRLVLKLASRLLDRGALSIGAKTQLLCSLCDVQYDYGRVPNLARLLRSQTTLDCQSSSSSGAVHDRPAAVMNPGASKVRRLGSASGPLALLASAYGEGDGDDDDDEADDECASRNNADHDDEDADEIIVDNTGHGSSVACESASSAAVSPTASGDAWPLASSAEAGVRRARLLLALRLLLDCSDGNHGFVSDTVSGSSNPMETGTTSGMSSGSASSVNATSEFSAETAGTSIGTGTATGANHNQSSSAASLVATSATTFASIGDSDDRIDQPSTRGSISNAHIDAHAFRACVAFVERTLSALGSNTRPHQGGGMTASLESPSPIAASSLDSTSMATTKTMDSAAAVADSMRGMMAQFSEEDDELVALLDASLALAERCENICAANIFSSATVKVSGVDTAKPSINGIGKSAALVDAGGTDDIEADFRGDGLHALARISATYLHPFAVMSALVGADVVIDDADDDDDDDDDDDGDDDDDDADAGECESDSGDVHDEGEEDEEYADAVSGELHDDDGDSDQADDDEPCDEENDDDDDDDTTLFVDWLMSDETDFLRVFCRFLRFATFTSFSELSSTQLAVSPPPSSHASFSSASLSAASHHHIISARLRRCLCVALPRRLDRLGRLSSRRRTSEQRLSDRRTAEQNSANGAAVNHGYEGEGDEGGALPFDVAPILRRLDALRTQWSAHA